jgi:zinc protease
MFTLRRNRLVRWGTIISLALVYFSGPAEAKTTRVKLDNGMEVIFKENHSSPMITSIVFVRAGAKYENEFNNGVTHLLEHLLFDGTQTRSRQEISEGIKSQGGYINAFTRKDLTGYLVLMPKENIQYGIEVQADQLFGSIFPDDELAKERKVVIEEIQKDNDDETSLADDFFNSVSMAGTAYDRPVAGYRNIIASILKDKIINYWKQFYAPNNMIGLVIGDFDTAEMMEMYKAVYGVIPPVNLPSPPLVKYFPPTERKVYHKAGNTKLTYITFAVDAPHFTDPDYFSFDLMAAYLGSDETSPLKAVLVDDQGKPLYQSYSANLETAEEFSRLVIQVVTANEKNTDRIIAGVDTVLAGFAGYAPSAEVLEGIKTTKKVDEIFMEEKLHYYGFTVAPLMVTTGWDFMESYLEAIGMVNPTMMVRASDRWLKELKYTAAVFSPRKETGKDKKEARYTTFRREVLPNGLTVVVKSNPDSRVFALNVIGRNRSASEPPGQTGITDFVNRMIKKGTTTLDAGQLDQKLAEIGAQVTLNDNAWIPYDDMYTTRQYSFMKFETIDDFTEPGLALFADMIRHPAFDQAAVEEVRGLLMGLLGRNSGSPVEVCRDLFYATLFEGQAYSKTIDGTPRTIGPITRADLVDYHKKYYSAGNMIITVGTNMNADTMMTMIKKAFGDMPKVNFVVEPAMPGPAIVGVTAAHQDLEKEQIYIYMGNLLPAVTDSSAAAIRVAAEVLSTRLQLNLREKQGLAYSVGAGANFDRDFGWFICSMGTGVANFGRARDGILAEIEKLKAEGPNGEELETAQNSIWGTSLTRRLSRINQAYYMGVGEYLGIGYDYEDRQIPQIRAVTAEQVKAAAAKYFDTVNYVLATAGKV